MEEINSEDEYSAFIEIQKAGEKVHFFFISLIN